MISKALSRREFLRSCVGAMGVALAAGCVPVPAAPAPAAGPAPQAGAAQGPTFLRFSVWYGESDIEVWDKVNDAFEEVHSSIKVDFEPLAWDQYWQKLQVGFAAGDPPDVIGMIMVYDYAARKQLLPLDPLLERDNIERGQWFPGLLKPGTWPIPNGQLFSLPYRMTGGGFFINKTLFDQAGIEYPQKGWTWPTEFLEKALALTAPEKEQWGTMVPWGHLVAPFLFTNEVRVLTEDARHSNVLDPKVEEVFQFMQDLICKHKVAPSMEAVSGLGDYFLSGKVAMNPSALWNIPAYRKITDFEWDIVYYPLKEGVMKPGPWFGPDSLSIPTASKHSDEAWKFLSFVAGTREAQRLMSATGIPVLIEQANDPEYLSEQAKLGPASYALVLEDAADGDVFSPSPGWAEWTAVMSQYLPEIYNCRMPVKQALTEIHQKVEEILTQVWTKLDELAQT